MELLRKRPVAVIITVVIVLLSTMFSVNRSLGAKAAAIEDGFYDGVVYDGYIHKSAASQLRVRIDSAGGLISVGKNYDGLSGLCTDLSSARTALESILNADGSIHDMYDADAAMETAFRQLLEGLEDSGMSDRDADSAVLYGENFDGAAKVIRNCAYNEAVREFERDTLGQFPTGLLASLCFVDEPETFE